MLRKLETGNHNPKVASSNLATATTKPNSVKTKEFLKIPSNLNEK